MVDIEQEDIARKTIEKSNCKVFDTHIHYKEDVIESHIHFICEDKDRIDTMSMIKFLKNY